MTIHVYPTRTSSLSLVHPTHGPMTSEGALWPHDSFSCRRLTDGSVTLTAPVSAPAIVAVTVKPTISPTINKVIPVAIDDAHSDDVAE
jgi:hypothetical protein